MAIKSEGAGLMRSRRVSGFSTESSRCSGAILLEIAMASSISSVWISAPLFFKAVSMIFFLSIEGNNFSILFSTLSINVLSGQRRIDCASSSCSA